MKPFSKWTKEEVECPDAIEAGCRSFLKNVRNGQSKCSGPRRGTAEEEVGMGTGDDSPSSITEELGQRAKDAATTGMGVVKPFGRVSPSFDERRSGERRELATPNSSPPRKGQEITISIDEDTCKEYLQGVKAQKSRGGYIGSLRENLGSNCKEFLQSKVEEIRSVLA